jgi:hypothetical protein
MGFFSSASAAGAPARNSGRNLGPRHSGADAPGSPSKHGQTKHGSRLNPHGSGAGGGRLGLGGVSSKQFARPGGGGGGGSPLPAYVISLLRSQRFWQGLTLVSISAQLELFWRPHVPT